MGSVLVIDSLGDITDVVRNVALVVLGGIGAIFFAAAALKVPMVALGLGALAIPATAVAGLSGLVGAQIEHASIIPALEEKYGVSIDQGDVGSPSSIWRIDGFLTTCDATRAEGANPILICPDYPLAARRTE